MGEAPTPVFIFSLPRSGSTLAQRILAAHEDVATASEPWLLLPYFYTLKRGGVYAEFNHAALVNAIEDFCSVLPGGREEYLAEIREMVLRLYGRAAPEGVRYFLDKTPRYHLIAGDIVSAFPGARYIFLWRNPLSVVSSIIETWGGGRWNLYRHKIDLFEGLENLIRTYTTAGDRAHAVRYEDLVTDPEDTWRGVFRYLGLPFDGSVLDSFGSIKLKGRKGDPTGTRIYDGVSRSSLERWRQTLNTPFRKAWCRRYLHWIGAERLRIMGYDYEELMAELSSLRVSGKRIASDAFRACYGLAYATSEPGILREKLRALPEWKRIHVHK